MTKLEKKKIILKNKKANLIYCNKIFKIKYKNYKLKIIN